MAAWLLARFAASRPQRDTLEAPLRSVLTGLANVKLLAACDLAEVERLLDFCEREARGWTKTEIAELANAASHASGAGRNTVPLWLFLRFGARPAAV
jgi:hypothetical protein